MPGRRDFEKLPAAAVARASECPDIQAAGGPPGTRRDRLAALQGDSERGVMSRRGGNRSEWPRRAETRRRRPEARYELKPPPSRRPAREGGDSGYACASLDTLGRVGCYRARGLAGWRRHGRGESGWPGRAADRRRVTTNGPNGKRRLMTGLYPYAAYKASGAPWLGDVPTHWEVFQLGRLGVFSKGSGGTKNDEIANGIPCVRYGDLYTTHKFFIDGTRSCVSPAKASAYTPINKGGRSLFCIRRDARRDWQIRSQLNAHSGYLRGRRNHISAYSYNCA